MKSKDYSDCSGCRYLLEGFHVSLCRALQLPKPVSYMRNPLSRCGPERKMFDPQAPKKPDYNEEW